MAVVLGPEVDRTLRNLGEELKGRTHLEEPHVDKKTIIRAVREQNGVILTLQERILKMEEAEETMRRALGMLQERVDRFENYYGEKVDEVEKVLAEKMPVVDQTSRDVREHGDVLQRISVEVEDHGRVMKSFRTHVNDALSKTDSRIDKLDQTVTDMPQTIVISTRQIRHQDKHGDEDETEYLADIITQQEQQSVLLEEDTHRLRSQLHSQAELQEKKHAQIQETVSDLVTWKEEQSGVDLVTIRENQNQMQTTITHHETELAEKMSRTEVDSKLKTQFDDIVKHLSTALASVESDEADFKSITDSLAKMCQFLKEQKADKSDIASLRNQFIENQVDANGHGSNGVPLGGSNIDNEALRKILSDYPTNDLLLQMLDTKADKDYTVPFFQKTDACIKDMQTIIDKLLSNAAEQLLENNGKMVMKAKTFGMPDLGQTITGNQDIDNSADFIDKGIFQDNDRIDSNREHHRQTPPTSLYRLDGEAVEISDSPLHVESTKISSCKTQQPRPANSTNQSEESRQIATPITTNRSRKDTGKNNDIEKEITDNEFPSSSAKNGPLSECCATDPTEHAEGTEAGAATPLLSPEAIPIKEFLQSKTIRPKSVPPDPAIKFSSSRKHSLPIIANAIGKTSKPRSIPTNALPRRSKGIHCDVSPSPIVHKVLPTVVGNVGKEGGKLFSSINYHRTADVVTKSNEEMYQKSIIIKTSIVKKKD